ncbi:MAG: hypothetical protein ACXWPM_10800 [Bdellovibrionota bacterium]
MKKWKLLLGMSLAVFFQLAPLSALADMNGDLKSLKVQREALREKISDQEVLIQDLSSQRQKLLDGAAFADEALTQASLERQAHQLDDKILALEKKKGLMVQTLRANEKESSDLRATCRTCTEIAKTPDRSLKINKTDLDRAVELTVQGIKKLEQRRDLATQGDARLKREIESMKPRLPTPADYEMSAITRYIEDLRKENPGYYQELVKQANNHMNEKGFPMQPSWPTYYNGWPGLVPSTLPGTSATGAGRF